MNRRSLRILALVPDAFGSHGGISKFSRDLLSALCAYPDCAEVVVLPRLMPAAPGTLPAKLTWITTGLGGVFPADVLVGVVREVVPEVSGKSSIAVITPGTDPRTVRHAFIITNF